MISVSWALVHSRWHCPLADHWWQPHPDHSEQVAHERGAAPLSATQSAIARTSRLFHNRSQRLRITPILRTALLCGARSSSPSSVSTGSLAVDVAIAFRFFTLFA